MATPAQCSRPVAFCKKTGSIYNDTADCDADGVNDLFCSDGDGPSGYISTANGCKFTWPNSVCPPAVSGKLLVAMTPPCSMFFKCQACQGDCNSDNDCVPGLKCFQRNSSYEIVPGCDKGNIGDIAHYHYCYDPSPYFPTTTTTTTTTTSTTSQGCLTSIENPPEIYRTYSSVLTNSAGVVGFAQSMLDSTQAWSAGTTQSGEWMQIDLGSVKHVAGFVAQGNTEADEWVIRFTPLISRDGFSWSNVPGSFTGNSDRDTKVKMAMSTIILARYVRLVVQSWHGHISLRAGVVICETCSFTTAATCANARCTWDGTECQEPGVTYNVTTNAYCVGNWYNDFASHTLEGSVAECKTKCDHSQTCLAVSYGRPGGGHQGKCVLCTSKETSSFSYFDTYAKTQDFLGFFR